MVATFARLKWEQGSARKLLLGSIAIVPVARLLFHSIDLSSGFDDATSTDT